MGVTSWGWCWCKRRFRTVKNAVMFVCFVIDFVVARCDVYLLLLLLYCDGAESVVVVVVAYRMAVVM